MFHTKLCFPEIEGIDYNIDSMQIFVALYFKNTPPPHPPSADQMSLHFPFFEITLEADR